MDDKDLIDKLYLLERHDFLELSNKEIVEVIIREGKYNLFSIRRFLWFEKDLELHDFVKATADKLREQGIKAGVLKLRVFRPFPAEEISRALSKAKAVAVLDKADGLNAVGGPLFTDVTSGMYVNNIKVPTVSYIYGIGGRDTKSDDIEKVYIDLQEIVKSGNVVNPYRYLGLRRED